MIVECMRIQLFVYLEKSPADCRTQRIIDRHQEYPEMDSGQRSLDSLRVAANLEGFKHGLAGGGCEPGTPLTAFPEAPGR